MAAIAAVTVTVTVTDTVSDGVLQGIWKNTQAEDQRYFCVRRSFARHLEKHLRPKTRGTFVSESLQSQIASTSNDC